MQATKCHSCLNKITLHQGRWCNNKNKNYSEVGEYLCCIISIVAHVAIGWWNHQKKNVVLVVHTIFVVLMVSGYSVFWHAWQQPLCLKSCMFMGMIIQKCPCDNR